MWESVALVNESYIADVPAHVEEALKQMQFGAAALNTESKPA